MRPFALPHRVFCPCVFNQGVALKKTQQDLGFSENRPTHAVMTVQNKLTERGKGTEAHASETERQNLNLNPTQRKPHHENSEPFQSIQV